MNKFIKDNKNQNPGYKYKINEQIKQEEIRVVEGIEVGVYKTKDALSIAKNMQLDLVLINEKANPPICKIADIGKLLYKEKLHEKKIKDNSLKSTLKEVNFSPNIADNDFEVKKKNIVKFLKRGDKVKISMIFKGRQMSFKDKGELILLKLASEIEECGVPESMPKLNGKNMSFIIKPKK